MNNVFSVIGATNHSDGERQPEDYYATEPKAVEILLENEKFSQNIWECAVGEGHIAKVLENRGYNVLKSDIINRGYPNTKIIDFLKFDKKELTCDIITNPPYKYAQEFVEKSLECVKQGNKIAMLLKLTFLEGKSRKSMFLNNPPTKLYVSSSRLNCAKNGKFDEYKSSAIAYGWYIWEKGYKGDTIIKWIN